MIDVHCHYLPAVDDGPQELQSALMLLRHACRDGVDRIVLTPHVRAGYWENTLSFLRPRFDAFRKFVAAKNIEVELFLGAEVHFEPESFRLLRQGEIPFVGGWEGMKVLLLEFPDHDIPPNALDGVRYLVQQGVLPMIAHPERNAVVMSRPAVLEAFIEEGCLLQLTAAAVLGEFGQRASRAASDIIRHGWATMVASDAHSLRARPPRMRAVRRFLTERYDEATAEQLTLIAPARLLWERQLLDVDGTLRLAGAPLWSSASGGTVPPRLHLSGRGQASGKDDADTGDDWPDTQSSLRARQEEESLASLLAAWPTTEDPPPTQVVRKETAGNEVSALAARRADHADARAARVPRPVISPADTAAAADAVAQRLGPDGRPLRRQRLWPERPPQTTLLLPGAPENRAWRDNVSEARDPWDELDAVPPVRDIWHQRQAAAARVQDMDDDILRMRREWQLRMSGQENTPAGRRASARAGVRPPVQPTPPRQPFTPMRGTPPAAQRRSATPPPPAPARARVRARTAADPVTDIWEVDEQPIPARWRRTITRTRAEDDGNTVSRHTPAAGDSPGSRKERTGGSADEADVIDVEVVEERVR